jgi:hypothetical protein
MKASFSIHYDNEGNCVKVTAPPEDLDKMPEIGEKAPEGPKGVASIGNYTITTIMPSTTAGAEASAGGCCIWVFINGQWYCLPC